MATTFKIPGGGSSKAGQAHRHLLSLLVIAVAVLFALGGGALRAQSAPIAAEEGAPMKHFIFLFRQSPTALSKADEQRRADEVFEWAQQQNSQGRRLDPRKLGKDIHRIFPSGLLHATCECDVESLSAILFLEAHNFDEAVRIAESHPGLKYGASVEIREWAPPQPPRFQPVDGASAVATVARTSLSGPLKTCDSALRQCYLGTVTVRPGIPRQIPAAATSRA